MNKKCILFVLFAACLFFVSSAEDPIPNLNQPKYMVFTSGQPTEAGFQELAAMGIKTVINVLPEDECLKGEETMVESNRMAYHKLPFEASALKRETVDQFALLLVSVEQPVLIHCSTGNHVGGLWFAYRVLVNKAPLATALKEGRRIGMKPAMEDTVFDWLVKETTTVKS
jgi:uncharacterized protein (TIGR01244 family)